MARPGRRGNQSRFSHFYSRSAGHPGVSFLQRPDIHGVIGRCKLDDPFLTGALGSRCSQLVSGGQLAAPIDRHMNFRPRAARAAAQTSEQRLQLCLLEVIRPARKIKTFFPAAQ